MKFHTEIYTIIGVNTRMILGVSVNLSQRMPTPWFYKAAARFHIPTANIIFIEKRRDGCTFFDEDGAWLTPHRLGGTTDGLLSHRPRWQPGWGAPSHPPTELW